MRVLIIELGGSHMESVYSIVHLLHLKKQSTFLLCNKGLADLIKEKEKIDGIHLVPDTPDSLKTQISVFRQIRSLIKDKKIDTVIFGTSEIKIVRNLLPFLPSVNCIGIVHNASKLDHSGTFRYIYRFWIKKYIVLGDFARSQLSKYPKEKVLPFYPLYFPQPARSLVSKKEGEKWVIVPGGVISERKDYKSLLDGLAKYPIPENVKIIFLGKFSSAEAELRNQVDAINKRQQNIITFDAFLDYDIFHNYISLADFMLPLLKIENDSFYSNSRVSGAFNLAYGYKLPVLIPGSYKKNADLRPFAVYYDSMEGLIKILQSVNEMRGTVADIKNSYRNTEKFNLEKMATSFLSFINTGKSAN